MILRRTLGNLTASDLALLEQYKPPAGSGSTAQALYDQWVYQVENYRENGNRRWVNGQWVQSDTPPPPPVYGAAGANPLYAAITGGGNASVPYTPGQYTVSSGGEFNPPPNWGMGTEIAPAGYVPPSSAKPAATPAAGPSTPQTSAAAQTPAQQQQTAQQLPAGSGAVASFTTWFGEQPWYVLAGAAAFLLFVMRGSR